MTCSKYRIPRKEEFVPGFKFEAYLKSGGGSWFIMNGDSDELPADEFSAVNKQPTVEKWEEFTVPNIPGYMIDFDFPFHIDSLLKKQNIRTNVALDKKED